MYSNHENVKRRRCLLTFRQLSMVKMDDAVVAQAVVRHVAIQSKGVRHGAVKDKG